MRKWFNTLLGEFSEADSSAAPPAEASTPKPVVRECEHDWERVETISFSDFVRKVAADKELLLSSEVVGKIAGEMGSLNCFSKSVDALVCLSCGAVNYTHSQGYYGDTVNSYEYVETYFKTMQDNVQRKAQALKLYEEAQRRTPCGV